MYKTQAIEDVPFLAPSPFGEGWGEVRGGVSYIILIPDFLEDGLKKTNKFQEDTKL